MISTVRDRSSTRIQRVSILDYLPRSHYNSLVSCSPRILLFPSLFDLGERKEIATAGLPFAGHYPVIVSPLLSSPLVSLYYHQDSLSFLSFFFQSIEIDRILKVDKVGINSWNAIVSQGQDRSYPLSSSRVKVILEYIWNIRECLFGIVR